MMGISRLPQHSSTEPLKWLQGVLGQKNLPARPAFQYVTQTLFGAVLVYRYTGEYLLFSYPYMELWRIR